MGALRLSRLGSRLNLLLARRLVDVEFYLNRYPDVRAAGVDPVRHFAECGCGVPMRAANPAMERAIIRLSPLLALAVAVLPIRRDDWLQCFAARYQDLWCSDMGPEYRFARRVARLLATRAARGRGPGDGAVDRILGTTLPVARTADGLPWLTVRMMDPPEIHRFTALRLWGGRIAPTPREVTLPPLSCATVRDARVFGAMQIAAHGHFVAYEPAADPKLSFVAGQYRHVIACYPPRDDKIVARIPEHASAHLEEAILLGGRCSNNHFHFLIEYLSKGYLIDRLDLPNAVPLIISDNLFPAQMEALRLFFPTRPVVAMSNQQRLDVARLHIPSLMTYLPDALEIADWKKEGLRPASLRWLRTRAYAALDLEDAAERPVSRIFLARRRGRNIVNADAVEAVFARHGFAVVDPSQLSFAAQVRLFAGATHIAGPLGAAFSNTVFCRPGTAILSLGSCYAVGSSLFQNLAESMGCHCVHVVGEKPARAVLRLRTNTISLRHESFTIDTRRLDDALTTWLAGHGSEP